MGDKKIPSHEQCSSAVDRVCSQQADEMTSYLAVAAALAQDALVHLGRCLAYEELGEPAPDGYVAIAVEHLRGAADRLERGRMSPEEWAHIVAPRPIIARGVLPTDRDQLRGVIRALPSDDAEVV